MQGQIIRLSNIGVHGIDPSFAIPAPAASAILTIGNVIREIFPNNSRMTMHKMMSLSVTVDRTVTNEVYTAKFLSFLINLLTNP